MQLDQIGPDYFENLRDSALTLRQQAQLVEAVVAEVRRLPHHDLRAAPPFAVVLRGPKAPLLAQGMITIEHSGDAPFSVFMVPIGPDAKGQRYELTFN
jgi:hypothetical protein